MRGCPPARRSPAVGYRSCPVGCACPRPGVVAEGFGDGADRLGDLTLDDPEGVTAHCQVRQRLQVLVGQHPGICVVAVDGLEDQVDGLGLIVGSEDRGLLVTLGDQDLLLAGPFGGKDLGLPFPHSLRRVASSPISNDSATRARPGLGRRGGLSQLNWAPEPEARSASNAITVRPHERSPGPVRSTSTPAEQDGSRYFSRCRNPAES